MRATKTFPNGYNSTMNTIVTIPENHPQRLQLHNEAHARKSADLRVPVRASHLALMLHGKEKQRERLHLAELCAAFDREPPLQDADHFSADFGEFRLRWQQHGEFSTYTFFRHGAFADPFARPAITFVPDQWLEQLCGKVIVASHAAMVKLDNEFDLDSIAGYFSDEMLIGSEITGGAALAFTDFKIYADGFSRFLILDKNFQHWQAGRYLQRLFEIEVYRVMALLAFPMARKLIPKLNRADQDLLAITASMNEDGVDDGELLDELTALAAEIENCCSKTHFRFNAADAYYKLVERRIEELREVRIPGMQTIGEFLKRRLEPAIHTCQTTEKRLSMLSERISNAGQLLRTRVDITLERQNQALLASMDKRAHLQLHLQTTVEGLSVAAISYYLVSLVGYLAKAAKAFGVPVVPEMITGAAIPVVIGITALAVRHVRKLID